MGELVIDFKNDGEVSALHMDGFDLGFLGDKKVFRQSDITFCPDTQKWNLVYLVNGDQPFMHTVLCGFPAYDIARKFEVNWLNDCRLQGINPISAEGVEVMNHLRQNETGWAALDRIQGGYPVGELVILAAGRGHPSPKPEGSANDVVKTILGCEHYKSVFPE